MLNYSSNVNIDHSLECTHIIIREPFEPPEVTNNTLKKTNSNNSNHSNNETQASSNPSEVKMTDLKDPFKALEVDHKESEIVEISENTECSIAIKIGDRSYKTLWDTGAGRCVISKDKYSSIPDKR